MSAHAALALLQASRRPALPAQPVRPSVPVAPAAAAAPAPVPAASSGSAYPGARRGNIAVALQAAATAAGRQAALDALARDVYAPKSQVVRATWLRTWLTLHEAAHAAVPHSVPPFPLTPDIIARVASLFKAGSYLSFDNYMMRAKSEHLALGLTGAGAWTIELSTAMRDAIRSCERGAGVSRQSKPLDAIAVANLDLPDTPLVTGGPVAPADFAIAGCFFLLREVELASARAEHVTVAAGQQAVTWLLPTSKTDHKAVGVSRTWDCCCSVPELQPACPVHSLIRQLARADAAAARLGCRRSDMPLFFTDSGEEVDRAAAVGTIFRLAELTGERITDSSGAYRFGGHSLRTGGAHLLASRGVNPFRIQSLGRWKSALVVHYAGESMATGIAQEVRSGAAAARTDAVAHSELRRFLERLEARLAALEAAPVPSPALSPAADVTGPVVDSAEAYILNRDTGSVHRTLIAASAPPSYTNRSAGGPFRRGRTQGCQTSPMAHLSKISAPDVAPRNDYSQGRMS